MSDRHFKRHRRRRDDGCELPSYGKSMAVEVEVEEELYLFAACRQAGVSYGCAIKFCGGTGSLPALLDLPKGPGWRGSKDCAAVRLWIKKILNPVVVK